MLNKNKRKIQLFILIAILVVIPFISLGYSALSTTLNIRADIASILNPHDIDFPDEIEEATNEEDSRCLV